MKTREQLFGKMPKFDINKKNVLLLTHTDMDGAGASVLLNAIKADDAEVTVQHCPNNTMSKNIVDSVTKNDIAGQYDMIIACDISCNTADAEHINNHPNKYKFVLLDHHDTAMVLNKYDWACVCTEIPSDSFRVAKYTDDKPGHSSGTSLLYEYLVYCGAISPAADNADIMSFFVHAVAAYDTWDWVDIFEKKDLIPFNLNRLCYAMGIDLFEETMAETIRSASNGTDPETQIFTDTCKLILEIEQRKIDAVVKSMEKCLINDTITIDNQAYSMVYCYTDKYLPYVFDMMQEKYPDRDLYAINYGTGVSIRTRKENIHVGHLLLKIGGGGHAGAGGVKAHDVHQKAYMEMILQGKMSSTT